jgi:hypothetical protein
VLQPTEEELQTPWYTNLSLPADDEHNILDAIVTGEVDNVEPQIPDNIRVQETTSRGTSRTSTGVGPSSASGASRYITEDRMEEMLGMYRQHTISDVSSLCGNLKAEFVEESRALNQDILESQKQLFE